MTLTSGLATYFILWWLVFIAVLPFGANSPHELGEESGYGEAPSAPKNPNLLKKLAAATVVAAIIFAGVYTLISSDLISLDDVPFLGGLKPYS